MPGAGEVIGTDVDAVVVVVVEELAEEDVHDDDGVAEVGGRGPFGVRLADEGDGGMLSLEAAGESIGFCCCCCCCCC